MLIARAPLRITLAGGGTDLPSFYSRHGGMVIAAAIDRHVYVAVNRTFTDDYFLKYSALERVATAEEIDHDILREALIAHSIGPAVEVVSLADIPSGTGLGSSGSFTIALLRAIYAFKREHFTPGALAEEACSIEIERLGRAVGKQDQYIAAFGGLTRFDIGTDGHVAVKPLAISNDTLHKLEERLQLFFTGYSRNAEAVLEDQRSRTEADDASMIEQMLQVKEAASVIADALEAGDVATFAEELDRHWRRKRKRTEGMSNSAIDGWYELGRANGALGGKLVGAGGGGFLLFYSGDPARVRTAMTGAGLQEVRFSFDHDGAALMVRT